MSPSNRPVGVRHYIISGSPRLVRGSPIGFSGSGIWLISMPGFVILKEKGDEIRDCNYCNYDRDTGFGDFNRRESGNVALKKPRFGNSRD